MALEVVRSSKLARYMVCAGYAFLDGEEPEAGQPAKDGTAFGELAQALLEGRPAPTYAENGVFIDDDMRFYSKPLVENILGRAKTQVLCETRIDWQTSSGIWIRGQYDAAYVDDLGRLCIDDFKYGWGIVEVKENWQLLAYAIGEVIRRGQAFDSIVMRILQPRPHHEDGTMREWIISYSELLKYKEMIEKRMTELANGRSDFQTSNQCKYCKGVAESCPAFSKLFYRALEVSHEFVQDSLTNEDLAMQLDHAKRAEQVLKIKLDSLVELGATRIKQGQIIPGYVHTNTYSQRQWKPGVSPEAIKAITGKNVIETSIMSPAKVEKLGVSRKFIEQLTVTNLTGVKLEKKNGSDVGNKIFGNSTPTIS